MDRTPFWTSCSPSSSRSKAFALCLSLFCASPVLAASSNPVIAYHCNEGAGTTLTDVSGNNYKGTLSGGATWSTAGKYGGALSLDGVNDWVQVPSAPSFPLSAVTMGWWVNVPTSGFNDWADWWALQTSTGGVNTWRRSMEAEILPCMRLVLSRAQTS